MKSGPGNALTPRPSLTLPALRQAVATVAPGRLPEMFTKMQEAFVRAGEQGRVTPIHMFYREWAVIVEIERHPEIARRLHTAARALMSEDPQVRDAAILDAGESYAPRTARWLVSDGRQEPHRDERLNEAIMDVFRCMAATRRICEPRDAIFLIPTARTSRWHRARAIGCGLR